MLYKDICTHMYVYQTPDSKAANAFDMNHKYEAMLSKYHQV